MRIQGNDLSRDSFKEQMIDGLNTLNSHLNELNKTLQVIASNQERIDINEALPTSNKAADIEETLKKHDSQVIEKMKSIVDQNHLSDY